MKMLRAVVRAVLLGIEPGTPEYIGGRVWQRGGPEGVSNFPRLVAIHHHPAVMNWPAARVLSSGDHLPLLGVGAASGHSLGPHFLSLAILRHLQDDPGACPYLMAPRSTASPSSARPLPVCHSPCGLWGTQSLRPDWKPPRSKQLMFSVVPQG